jgi:phosphoglycolate phosphatase-like HAD superfamily hydrolase
MTQPTIVLFDIDGTIVTTGGAGRRAITRSLDACGLDVTTDFSFAGMTDRGIIRRALGDGGRRVTETAIDVVLAPYLELLQDEVNAASDDDYRVHRGILEAIDAAHAAAHIACGLGTGNIEAGARIKLARVGLGERFAFGGFGDDAEDRAALLRAAAERGAERLSTPHQYCRVVVIGDSPRDIRAAHAIDAECIAVSTGVIAAEELARYQPDLLVPDMAAPGAIEAMLGC